MNPNYMLINRPRLQQTIETLSGIGGSPDGALTRLAFTDEDRAARDQMVTWMQEVGLRVSIDQMGNIFGQRPGTESLPPLLIGSHIDSVLTGGRYDGQLGVLCGLEVIRVLNDENVRTHHPVGLVIFSAEEGSRFQPAMLGSGVMAAKIPLEDAHNTRDVDGVRLGEALSRIGYLGANFCGPRPITAYLELHVEQGPILEEAGCAVGVVEGVVGLAWSRLTLRGVQAHAGSTPMTRRRDPLVAAAKIVCAVAGIPAQVNSEMVATVGRLEVSPNIVNAVARRTVLTTDIRAPRDEDLHQAHRLLDEAVRKAAEEGEVEHQVEHYWRVPPIYFDRTVVDAIEHAAGSLGCRHRRIFSGQGHDAQYIATFAPSGMIFVPSKDGRGHCKEEFTPLEAIEAGANTLLLATLELAR